MADPDEEQIAGAHADVLCALGRLKIGGGHGVTRLQPGHVPGPRDVEK